MTQPTVTVVIPTYRDSVRILDALQSVIAQTRGDWEAVVVDDGSPEDVQAQIATGVAGLGEGRIRLVMSRKNRGPARARNLGMRLARGRFVAFLDADDLWHPDKLAVQLAAMPGAALSCTTYENADEETGARSERVPPARLTYEGTLRANAIGCSTVILDRAVLGRSYFPDIRMRQDFAHWLKILRAGHVVIGLPEALTTRRIHPGGLSANKLRAVRYTWLMLRRIEGLSALHAGYIMVYQVFGGLLRKLRP